jgi:hypothetical protein
MTVGAQIDRWAAPDFVDGQKLTAVSPIPLDASSIQQEAKASAAPADDDRSRHNESILACSEDDLTHLFYPFGQQTGLHRLWH